MARIMQVTWQWSGTSGGAGFTNLYFQSTVGDPAEALECANKSRVLFQGMTAHLPDPVLISLNSDVRLIEDTTGDLVNIFTVVGPSPVQGIGGTAGFAGASGGCVDWLTGVIHGKHLMVGRTFFVPLTADSYSSSGALTPQTVTAIGTAAESMRTGTGAPFGVWGRPRKAKVPPDPNKPQLTGHWAQAISSRVPNKAVVLRSRRD
jgi:hypothetical protein